MKYYSFLNEFSGNCAAGITGVESLATKSTITSKPIDSLLKMKPKRTNKNAAVKKNHTGVKSLVR